MSSARSARSPRPQEAAELHLVELREVAPAAPRLPARAGEAPGRSRWAGVTTASWRPGRPSRRATRWRRCQPRGSAGQLERGLAGEAAVHHEGVDPAVELAHVGASSVLEGDPDLDRVAVGDVDPERAGRAPAGTSTAAASGASGPARAGSARRRRPPGSRRPRRARTGWRRPCRPRRRRTRPASPSTRWRRRGPWRAPRGSATGHSRPLPAQVSRKRRCGQVMASHSQAR